MKKFTGQQQEKFLALVCGDVKILPLLSSESWYGLHYDARSPMV